MFVEALAQSSRFLRGETAAGAGVNRGLAIPCTTRGNQNHVLTLLASAATPIALRVETYEPDAARSALHRASGFCEIEGRLPAATTGPALDAEAGCVARTFISGVPTLTDAAAAEPGAIGASAGACGADALVAIPIVNEGVVAEVLVLYF